MTTTSRSQRLSLALACCLAAGIASIGGLLYTTPLRLVGAMGLAPEVVTRFQDALPLARHLTPTSEVEFVWLFRVLLVATWLLWVALVVRAFRGSEPSTRSVVILAVSLAVGVAFFCPPVLSRDVYAYVAYGRLPYLYGLNPYLNDRAALKMAGDTSAEYLIWSSPLPYGPLWTLLATALAAVGQSASAYGEVVAHKLVAAVSLIAAAGGAARLAEHRESGRGPLTFLAIALNPLLVIEGPGSGHNDFVMVAMLVWAAVLFAEHRSSWSALLVGMAMAVKPVAVLALPLLLFQEWIREPTTGRLPRLIGSVAIAIAPGLVLSLPFGGPAIVVRSVLAQGAAPIGSGGRLLGLGIASLVTLWAARFIVANSRTLRAAWLTAWIPVSVVLIMVGTRQWFPWYASWALLPALAGWDERHRVLTTVAATFGLLLTWVYTYRP